MQKFRDRFKSCRKNVRETLFITVDMNKGKPAQ